MLAKVAGTCGEEVGCTDLGDGEEELRAENKST